MNDQDSPLGTAVHTMNDGVLDIANAALSLPNAAARGVSSALHGQAKVEAAIGPFQPRPVDEILERLGIQPNLTGRTP